MLNHDQREKRVGRTEKALQRSRSRDRDMFRSLGRDPSTKVPVNETPAVAKSKDLTWS